MCKHEFSPGTTIPTIHPAAMGRLKIMLQLFLPRNVVADRNDKQWAINMSIGASKVTATITGTLEKTSVWEGPLVHRGYAIQNRWEAFRYLLPKFLRKGKVKLTPIMVPSEIHYIIDGSKLTDGHQRS